MNFAQRFRLSAHMAGRFVRRMSASTIFSLSSGFAKCGVSVIRVSGPQTKQTLKAIVDERFEPRPRFAHLKALHDPQSREMIDKGLVLWFPGPASFTGEDSCEFQVHGSLAVIAAMLDALGRVPGLRPATPGEFTKRAFFGGKVDLTEVEGLADLIHAETEGQRKQALLQSTGALSRLYDGWRRRLIRCTAHLEAFIDFAEEDSIEDDVVRRLSEELRRLIADIGEHLDDQRQGEMLRGGVRAAIVGAPNVGKSSFLNLMCRRKVSIVTPLAGTTRDVIETTQNFGGYPVVFSDTAGLRQQTDDIVEREGIQRAKECLQRADLVLLIVEAPHLLQQQRETPLDYTQEFLKRLDLEAENFSYGRLQLVANKIDLLGAEEQRRLESLPGLMRISCTDEAKAAPFLRGFEALLADICGQPTAEHPRLTHARYRQQLERCVAHLQVFLEEYSPDFYPDTAIAAQKLRTALKCIERITGHVSTDDILDVVFKDFCIGK